MRAISLLAAALTIAGCTIQSSPPPAAGQIGSNSPPPAVAGLCQSPDVPPADVARNPGYRQFEVSVTNSEGWPVAGLTPKDFVLYSASQTFPVAYFREHKNDEPVAIALVVDTSSSMAPKLPAAKQSLREFVKDLNPCDEVVLFAFDTQVGLLQPFSTDHQMTAEKMELFNPYGKSALYDATNIALQSLEGADYPNRKLVLISDGRNDAGATAEMEVMARDAGDGIPIYTVGIGDPNAPATSGIAIGPLHIAVGQSYIPAGEPVLAGPSGIGQHTAYVPGIQPPSLATDRVEAGNLDDLSAMAGGRSFIVPTRGELGGESFETAVFAVADNIAKGYAIGAVIPGDVNPSAVRITVVKRLDLKVSAHQIGPGSRHN